jgi:rubrerythrin
MNMQKQSCDIVSDLIPLYVDGVCSEESCEFIEEHIRVCQSCKKLLENMLNNEVFQKKTGVHVWKCRNCGNLITSSKAPDICPVCMHPKAYFEINCENY